jgi:hypothetical protein
MRVTIKLSKGSSLTVCLSEKEGLAPRIAKLLSFIVFYHYVITNSTIKYPGSYRIRIFFKAHLTTKQREQGEPRDKDKHSL